MEVDRKESRPDVITRLIERVNRLEEMGIVGQDGDIMIDAEEATAIARVELNTIFAWAKRACPKNCVNDH